MEQIFGDLYGYRGDMLFKENDKWGVRQKGNTIFYLKQITCEPLPANCYGSEGKLREWSVGKDKQEKVLDRYQKLFCEENSRLEKAAIPRALDKGYKAFLTWDMVPWEQAEKVSLKTVSQAMKLYMFTGYQDFAKGLWVSRDGRRVWHASFSKATKDWDPDEAKRVWQAVSAKAKLEDMKECDVTRVRSKLEELSKKEESECSRADRNSCSAGSVAMRMAQELVSGEDLDTVDVCLYKLLFAEEGSLATEVADIQRERADRRSARWRKGKTVAKAAGKAGVAALVLLGLTSMVTSDQLGSAARWQGVGDAFANPELPLVAEPVEVEEVRAPGLPSLQQPAAPPTPVPPPAAPTAPAAAASTVPLPPDSSSNYLRGRGTTVDIGEVKVVELDDLLAGGPKAPVAGRPLLLPAPSGVARPAPRGYSDAERLAVAGQVQKVSADHPVASILARLEMFDTEMSPEDISNGSPDTVAASFTPNAHGLMFTLQQVQGVTDPVARSKATKILVNPQNYVLTWKGDHKLIGGVITAEQARDFLSDFKTTSFKNIEGDFKTTATDNRFHFEPHEESQLRQLRDSLAKEWPDDERIAKLDHLIENRELYETDRKFPKGGNLAPRTFKGRSSSSSRPDFSGVDDLLDSYRLNGETERKLLSKVETIARKKGLTNVAGKAKDIRENPERYQATSPKYGSDFQKQTYALDHPVSQHSPENDFVTYFLARAMDMLAGTPDQFLRDVVDQYQVKF